MMSNSVTMTTRFSMWEQYRKGLLATQLFIVTVCAILYFKHASPAAILIFFVMLQVAALIGAKWAARVKRKAMQSKEDLPLRPPR